MQDSCMSQDGFTILCINCPGGSFDSLRAYGLQPEGSSPALDTQFMWTLQQLDQTTDVVCNTTLLCMCVTGLIYETQFWLPG